MADETEPAYPRWDEVATKGEVMQALLRQRIVMGKLASALLSQMRDEPREAAEALREYFIADEALDKFAVKLGGGRGDE